LSPRQEDGTLVEARFEIPRHASTVQLFHYLISKGNFFPKMVSWLREFCGLGFSLGGSHENGLFFYALQEGTPTALRISSSN